MLHLRTKYTPAKKFQMTLCCQPLVFCFWRQKKGAEEKKKKLFLGEMIDTKAKKLKELSESVSKAKELNET